MKHSILRKTVSVIMTALLVILPLFTVIAAARENKIYPMVDVPGFMSYRSHFFEDPTDPDSPEAWPPSMDKILTAVKNCLPALSELSITRNWDKFADKLIPEALNVLEPVCYNARGEKVNKIGPRETYPSAEQIKETRYATFSYDWRADPFETAAKLDKFIDYVLEVTGSEKVNLICHSLGGVITLTYSTVYGNSKINTYIFHSTAIYGITYTGELLTGNMSISADALRCFINFALQSDKHQELVRGIADMLACAGLLDFVADMGNEIIDNLMPRAVPEVIMPLFGRWPTIWAMAPDDYYKAALDYVFYDIMEDNEDTAVFRAKVEKFNDEVRVNREDTLRKMDEECKIAVFAKYGYSSLPMTPGWNVNSDGIIDVANTSFGATSSAYTEKLSPEYINKVDPQYISPDRTVDASTSMFPDRTWYLREFTHSQVNPDMFRLIDLIISTDKEYTVYDNPEFPRFLKFGRADNTMIPDTVNKNPIMNFYQIFEEFYHRLYMFISKLREYFHS